MLICPFMSTPEKQVECMEKCALYCSKGCSLNDAATEYEFLTHKDILMLLSQIRDKLNTL